MKNLAISVVLLFIFPIIIIATCSEKFPDCIENEYVCKCISKECENDPYLLDLNQCDGENDSSGQGYMIATIILAIILVFSWCFFIAFILYCCNKGISLFRR